MSWHEQWLVVTDLDGTLLDHHDYSWEPAAGALQLLADHRVPVVFSSSKTLAEMRVLAAEMRLHQPLIIENGAAVAWPSGDGYEVKPLGRSRDEVVAIAHELRQRAGCDFEGFADWGPEQVAAHSGLELEAAELSLERHGTEPIIWQGSEPDYLAFVEALKAHGIRALRGGRFIHLMGDFDKVDGMRLVREHFSRERGQPMKVLALGDSPNDAAMLSAADVAVRIRSAKSAEMTIQACVLLQPKDPGPTGWASAVRQWWQAQGDPKSTE